MSTKSSHPLPLANILNDLAIIRSTGIIPSATQSTETGSLDDGTDASAVRKSVNESYNFVHAARAAIRLHDSGKVDAEGSRVDEVRTKYQVLLDDLNAGKPSTS
ncbi:hypothetical protein CPC08DRAFT_708481 [Agrocybe pediades]|nr:hypothetical protein CPC08DRAFT_708481 [Agrocybe pediades]